MAGDHDSPSETGAYDAGKPVAERFKPFGKNPLRTFSLAIGLPTFLFYVTSAILVLTALVMMGREIDRLEQQRELTAMAAALDTFLNSLSDAVADEGTWNEAHLNVVVTPSPAWMDETWGATARLGTTYDDVLVTDQQGAIVFGENNLGQIAGSIGDHYPASMAMLDELDHAITGSGDAAVVAHFAANKEGAPVGLAAISIHQSTTGEMAVPRHQRRILWIAKRLTPAILQDVAARYQVPLPQVVAEPGAGMSSISMKDVSGSTAGTIAWIPDRPGDVAFRHAAILATVVFFFIGLLLALGLRALRRAMLRRSGEIEAAFAEQVHDTQIAIAAAEVVAATPVEEEHHYSTIDGVSASDFEVQYQPIFDLRAESLIGVETLLRWNRPDRTVLLEEELGPDECAHLMERAGIMALRHAAGDVAPLLGLTLSLAIAPDQLTSEIFAEKVGATLSATNFQIRRLQLHVDATLLPELEKAAPHITELRRMGVTLALSNFVLSESVVAYIRQDLVDRVCLARPMVVGIGDDPVRQTLLQATIQAARSVGLAVTVPGIERREDAAHLLRLGCREFRGPLLADPMPLAALTALVLAPARPSKAG